MILRVGIPGFPTLTNRQDSDSTMSPPMPSTPRLWYQGDHRSLLHQPRPSRAPRVPDDRGGGHGHGIRLPQVALPQRARDAPSLAAVRFLVVVSGHIYVLLLLLPPVFFSWCELFGQHPLQFLKIRALLLMLCALLWVTRA